MLFPDIYIRLWACALKGLKWLQMQCHFGVQKYDAGDLPLVPLDRFDNELENIDILIINVGYFSVILCTYNLIYSACQTRVCGQQQECLLVLFDASDLPQVPLDRFIIFSSMNVDIFHEHFLDII